MVPGTMSWESKLPRVVRLSDQEVAGLDAHLDEVRGGTAKKRVGATEAPPSAGPDGPTLALTRGELIVHLGLEERDGELSFVGFAPTSMLGVADDRGRPRALICALADLDAELLGGLEGRALLLAGSVDQLWAFAGVCAEGGFEFEIAALVVTCVPVMLEAGKLLAERFGAPVLWGIPDSTGGWFAVSREPGGLLMQVRGGLELLAVGREGPVMPESWGLLGIGSATDYELVPHWVRRDVTRSGAVGLRLNVPPLAFGGSETNVAEIHDRLEQLPVFSYQIVMDDENPPTIRVSPLPGSEGAGEVISQALADLHGGEARGRLEVSAAGVEFDGPKIVDARGLFRNRAGVVWAGSAGSEARRGGWREAIRAAGFVGREISLLDAASGEPLAGVATEVADELRGERDPLSAMFGGAQGRRAIYVGDPALANETHRGAGWIILDEGSDDHEPMFIAASEARDAGLIQALFERGELSDRVAELSLDGVFMHGYSRPILARGGVDAADTRPLWVDESRCTGAGDCVRICPTGAIELRGEPARPVIDDAACIKCQLCTERCESSALRPLASVDSSLEGKVLVREAELVRTARLRKRPRALEGKLVEPPAALDKRAPALIKSKPTVVLGLATVTLMEHTAALLVDGELVSAVEEERLVRDRHYNWRHPERPGTSLSSDICLRVEEAWPPRAIDAVLRTAGMTMDDVDIVALNGIPGRFRRSFVGGWNWKPPPVLRANSMVFVPHHMSHAACVYGLSDLEDAWILSVDGRGDYETATIWRAEGHELQIIDAVPWRPDCSFGGVYETVTRALGFGTHGQGSTMALAALGEPSIDFSRCMSLDEAKRPVLSEWAADALVVPFERGYDDPIEDKHKNLAASLQRALETTVGDYLEHHTGGLRGKNLALCGGVALNCRMNGVLRDRFEPASMHVPPGANDAGTAIGAAMIGHRELTGELPRLGLGHTHFGPQWSDDAIASTLKRMRVPFQRLRQVGEQVAELLVAGKIVCWFQGPMEFGPRALGGRSITADPRRLDLKDRLNKMKTRQSWRPFGPSVLAGRQSDWFVQDWDSRYMLFAIDVLPHKRDEVPVIVHADGSTRPQMVHEEHQPRYHALISAFEKRTGVPMIVNTSFNRGGEPIVCNPAEAMRSFVGLGADAIVLGDCLVRREMLRRR